MVAIVIANLPGEMPVCRVTAIVGRLRGEEVRDPRCGQFLNRTLFSVDNGLTLTVLRDRDRDRTERVPRSIFILLDGRSGASQRRHRKQSKQ